MTDREQADILREAAYIACAPYLRRDEAAMVLRCDPVHFDRAYRGLLTEVRLSSSRHVLYLRAEIDQLVRGYAQKDNPAEQSRGRRRGAGGSESGKRGHALASNVADDLAAVKEVQR